jgi:antitoxin ParD1/3/4
MPASTCQKRTFSLPSAQGKYIDKLVKSGAYASASEVVREGLRALEAREGALNRWLREEVAASYDALEADPARAIPASEVFSAVRARYRKPGSRKA